MIKAIYQKRVEVQNNSQNPALGDLAFLGEQNILGKVIEISPDTNVILPLQNVESLRLNENVTYLKIDQITSTHPALFGRNWDILNNEISTDKLFVDIVKTKLSKQKYDFIPVVQNTSSVLKNQKIGYTQLSGSIKYWILSPIEGIVQNITVGSYSLNEKVAQIISDNVSFPVFFDARSDNNFVISKDSNSQTQLFCGLKVIDLFYPIVVGSKNFWENVGQEEILALRQNISCSCIIHISSSPIDNLSNSEICFVDFYGESGSLVEAVNSLAYSFAMMGIDVVVINHIESANNTIFGNVTNIDMEQGSVTIININNKNINSAMTFLSVQGHQVNPSLSFIRNTNLQDMIIDNSSISFFGDYNNFHKNKGDLEFLELIGEFLMIKEYDGFENLTKDYFNTVRQLS
jgi:hypothetical protein